MHRTEASWLISNLQQLIIFSIVKKPKNILELELEMGVDSNERMILEMSGIHLQLPNFRSTSSDIYYKLRSFLISSLLLTKIIGQRLPLWSLYEQYRYKASSGLEPRRPSGTLDRLVLWSSRWTLMLHALWLITCSLIQISSYFGFAFTLDVENSRSKLCSYPLILWLNFCRVWKRKTDFSFLLSDFWGIKHCQTCELEMTGLILNNSTGILLKYHHDIGNSRHDTSTTGKSSFNVIWHYFTNYFPF